MHKQTELAAATLASLALLLTGCNSSESDEAPVEAATDQIENAETPESTDGGALSGLNDMVDDVKDVDLGDLGLSLNDGKKWQLDDHTRTAITQVKDLVDGASIDSLESATAIGGQLKDAMTGLMEGSTLEGLAGEQLQGFIGKFMPSIESLTGAVDLEAAKAKFGEIKTMLTGFSAVFE